MPRVVQWRDGRQAELLTEEKILFATAGRDVDDARALLLADFIPGDDHVLDALLHGQLVERAAVALADQLVPALELDDVPASAEHLRAAGSATISVSPSLRTKAYVSSGCTAAATLEVSVHGVVVHTSRLCLGVDQRKPDVHGLSVWCPGSRRCRSPSG